MHDDKQRVEQREECVNILGSNDIVRCSRGVSYNL